MYDRRRKAFWSLICHNRISIEADRHSSPASGLLSVELFLSCLSKLYPSRRFPKPHAVQQMSGLSHLLAASGTCNWSVPSWVPARWKENPALSEGDRESAREWDQPQQNPEERFLLQIIWEIILMNGSRVPQN
ncbi:uncharacterized protein [Struthio camelus]|uniref:uncharacterized protein isoform X2 n=1 Tax=Struthio camelus TaxID=8801 RepID=UPI003604126D